MTTPPKGPSTTRFIEGLPWPPSDPRFSLPNVDPAKMQSDVQAATDLLPVLEGAQNAVNLVADTRLSLLADAWEQALAVYRVGLGIAASDASMAAEILRMESFLTPHKPKKKPAPPVGQTPPASPAAGASVHSLTEAAVAAPAHKPKRGRGWRSKIRRSVR